MILPDSVIAREKSEILMEYLHKVFCETMRHGSESGAGFCGDTGEQIQEKCSCPDCTGGRECYHAMQN